MTELLDPGLRALAGRFPRRQRIANILNDPEVWSIGEAIPRPPRHLGGAPRMYPNWMAVLYDTLIHEFGSAVDVERELSDPHLWAMLQTAARVRYPDEPEQWLPDKPMRRHHYTYVKRAYLKQQSTLDVAGASHRMESAALAVDCGLCVPEKGASWTHPKLGSRPAEWCNSTPA